MIRKNIRVVKNEVFSKIGERKFLELINFVVEYVDIKNIINKKEKKDEKLDTIIKYYIKKDDENKIKEKEYSITDYVRGVIEYYVNEVKEYEINIEELLKIKQWIKNRAKVHIKTKEKRFSHVIITDIQKFRDMPLFLEENKVYLEVYSIKENCTHRILYEEIIEKKESKLKPTKHDIYNMYEYYKNNCFDFVFLEFDDGYFENFKKRYEFIDNNGNVYMNYFRECKIVSKNKYYMEFQDILELKNYIFAYPNHIINIFPKIYEEIILNEINESFKDKDNYIILGSGKNE